MPSQKSDQELEKVYGPILFKFGMAIREICGKEQGKKLLDLLDPLEQEFKPAIETYTANAVRQELEAIYKQQEILKPREDNLNDFIYIRPDVISDAIKKYGGER